MKKFTSTVLGPALLSVLLPTALAGREFHVSMQGRDNDRGTESSPLRSLQRAADLAQPGDVITVHEGVYRERVNPPRGGTSDRERIVYQAARGAKVEIKGSEVIRNWEKVQPGVWKVTLPNSFFGAFNPYSDTIRGDWFEPRGRPHHTGAVYLNGEWLIEAAKLDEVLMPAGTAPAWLTPGGQGTLLNVAWLRPGQSPEAGRATSAAAFSAQEGVQKAPCSEGGECIGWIESGDWVRYEQIDFGRKTEQLELRAASATEGGVIEIRLNSATGLVLGSVAVPNTGGWQSWVTFKAPLKPVSGVKTVCLVFRAPGSNGTTAVPPLWFAQVDGAKTTIWAQFKEVNPNAELVEINVRRTVFYPDQPGRNYLTVRGFTLRQAATPWAPPTAEQVGLIGTHWSKGWIIENNVVSHSVCSGIALGKHGDEFDNTSANSAEGYVKTIERAHARGWSKETIGHHIVRNNTISHCEQAGIVGSLGAAFSTVTGNTIHDIHVRRLFTGAEMAGIKFHAAIDSVIAQNHIYRTCLGLWLDWMAQGTRVSGNLFHDNAGQDLFVEVNHGPFVVDNNLFLSGVSLLDVSEGGAYIHNLFNGKLINHPEPGRETPFHPAHSTTVAGLVNVRGGDNRFLNNIFFGRGLSAGLSSQPRKDPEWSGAYGLWMYGFREVPLLTGGNVYYNGALPYPNERDALVVSTPVPDVKLTLNGDQYQLHLPVGGEIKPAVTVPVDTKLLGRAKVPGLPYENADGSPIEIRTDYLGKKRSGRHPTPGPLEKSSKAAIVVNRR